MYESIKVLEKIQHKLSVSMIMTPRIALKTCRKNDSVKSIIEANNHNFTWIPVVGDSGHISHIFDTGSIKEEHPDAEIADFCLPINENIIIGGDASIYEFIETAEEQKFKLVVSGSEVSGLVTISDLQQLPVRVAIFSLITNLELLLADIITKFCPEDCDWEEKLSANRRVKLQEAVQKSEQSDLSVSKIVLTQFADKTTLATKLDLIDIPNTKLRKLFDNINKLRDEIAHASNFAEDELKATELCATVKSIFEIKRKLRYIQT